MRLLAPCIALALASPAVVAQSAADPAPRWTGTGELGFVSSSGNSRSESINAKFGLKFEDADWKYAFGAAAFRQKGEVVVLADPDDPDSATRRLQLNANRYQLDGSAARKLSERNSLYTSLRYENDDFAPYDYQATMSIGWGHQAIRTEATKLAFEVGPGYRRSKDAVTGAVENDVIGRGRMEFETALTANTSLVDTLLVEAGGDNTFAQNDVGVKVAMNSRFAIKAGLQVRHNTDVPPERRRTDRLTTVNLVYDFR